VHVEGVCGSNRILDREKGIMKILQSFAAAGLVAALAVPVLLPVAAGAAEPPVFLVIDEDSIDNGGAPNFFSDRDVNDQMAEIGVRTPLRYFAQNAGQTISLRTGQSGDEAWFMLDAVPASWASAGPTTDGIRNFVGDPSLPFPHGVGPGLGTRDAKGDRESLLDKIPDVDPLRREGLEALVGRTVCAVVFDSDVSVNYDPSTGSLKGANLGTVAFEVVELAAARRGALPAATIMILDAAEVCTGSSDDGGDPEPTDGGDPEPTDGGDPEPTDGGDPEPTDGGGDEPPL
jgi:hypothetical protein